MVLSAQRRVYSQTSDDQLEDIPAAVPVGRAFAFDAQRDLSIRGRYLRWMALPDLWVTWLLWAVPMGLRMIRQHKPALIWSTYPIVTAHLIGFVLHRLTGIPWVADFRDPMVEIDPRTQGRRPADRVGWRVWNAIERLTVKHCARAVFATLGSQRIYQDRYSEIPNDRWSVISNGYDEEQFSLAERDYRAQERDPKQIVLLHSGVLYGGTDRDPSGLFGALSKLKKSGQITASGMKVILRASGYEDHYRTLIRDAEIEDLVFLEPQIPYRAALAEMLGADGLLIFQGYTSNPAVPAKLYEYFRARRPILALVDGAGDTAGTLRDNGVGLIVAMDHVDDIADGVVEFIKQITERKGPVLDLTAAKRYSRRAQTQQLASLLDAIVQ